MSNGQEPIRVLCVFSWLDRGGAESMCMNIYRNLDRHLVQFDFVKHTDRKCEYEDEIMQLGGRIYTAPKFMEYNRISYQKWWREHLKNHPEHQIIHSHYFTIADVFLEVAKKAGRYTISHCHQSSYCINEKTSLKTLLIICHIKRGLKFSNKLFACSTDAGRWAFGDRDFEMVPNAIEMERFQFDNDIRLKVRHELGIKDEFVIGTVGRIMRVKNPYGTVGIFEKAHSIDTNTKLLWVGSDATMGREIRDEVDRRGLSDNVIFTGETSNVNDIMQAMDCFVLPSFSEGLPVTLIEAQSMGLNCIVGNNITRDANISGKCKYLPIDDKDAWAEEIMRIKKYGNIDRNSFKCEDYDVRQSANKLQHFYLGIIQH